MYFIFCIKSLNVPKCEKRVRATASRAGCRVRRRAGRRRPTPRQTARRGARDVPKTRRNVRLVYFEFDRDTDHRQSCIIERENV